MRLFFISFIIILFNLTFALAEPTPADSEKVDYDVAPWPLEGFCPQPEYPELARSAGIDGTVNVKVLLDKNGNVKKIVSISVNPKKIGFEAEIEKTLPKWKFSPASKKNNSIGVSLNLTFQFFLQSPYPYSEQSPRGKDKMLNISNKIHEVDSLNSIRGSNPKQIYTPPPIMYTYPEIKMEFPSIIRQ